jgi:hypothetical protein
MAVDALMASSVAVSGYYQTWDFMVVSGQVPIVSGMNGDQQNADISAFVQLGTIPQLPNKGVNWVGFLTGLITFGQLDANIRQALQDARAGGYVPHYVTKAGTLTVNIQLGSTG